MDLDLVVRNGFVVDGSGAPGVEADVGIAGDRVVVIGDIDERGREEIDAGGLVVAPGFVDGHTHMDAQVFWDQLGSSSCWHGITTAVMGNCGYTLAPVRPEDTGLVVANIERAEDIPAEVISGGIPWSWSTFPEYLDVLAALPKGINYAQAVGHCALRIWAMGDDAHERTATPDELERMEHELRAALRAGAAGFTTSRNKGHTTSDDRPVASRVASWDEVIALANVVGQHGSGCFQWGGAEEGSYIGQLDRMKDLALTTGVPTLLSAHNNLDALRMIERTVAEGGHMYGWTHCRQPICNLQSFHTRLSYDTLDGTWHDVRRRPLEEQRTLLRDPDIRARLIHEAHHGEYRPVAAADPFKPDYDNFWIMVSPYLPNPTVAEEARRRGVDPVEVVIDVALEHDFDIFFVQGYGKPPSEDVLIELMRSPHTAMTFTDAGAHVSEIVDASIQTHLLAYWVREREVFTIEEAIRMVSFQPARAWGLHDRGMLAPGFAADITIFDPDTVAPLPPQVLHDLPGGAARLEQRAAGYAATIVNGDVFTRDGEATDVRAGRLLRNGRLPVPTS